MDICNAVISCRTISWHPAVRHRSPSSLCVRYQEDRWIPFPHSERWAITITVHCGYYIVWDLAVGSSPCRIIFLSFVMTPPFFSWALIINMVLRSLLYTYKKEKELKFTQSMKLIIWKGTVHNPVAWRTLTVSAATPVSPPIRHFAPLGRASTQQQPVFPCSS